MADGAAAKNKTKRKPGRPPMDKRPATLDDMLNDEGLPVNPNPQSKDQNALQFARSLEPDAQRMNPNKGMYSGMANPHEYLEFYRHTVKSPLKGRPWAYPDAETLQAEVESYFDFCIHRRIAVSVAGLAAWLGITVSTLANWKKNRDTMHFYEVVEPAVAFIHAMVEQGALDGTVPVVAYIFSSKNYSGLKDVQEYTVEPRQMLTLQEQSSIIEALPDDV